MFTRCGSVVECLDQPALDSARFQDLGQRLRRKSFRMPQRQAVQSGRVAMCRSSRGVARGPGCQFDDRIDKTCVLGNGVVIDPEELIGELDALIKQKVDTQRLRISDQAHYILPTHRIIDQREDAETRPSHEQGEHDRGSNGTRDRPLPEPGDDRLERVADQDTDGERDENALGESQEQENADAGKHRQGEGSDIDASPRDRLGFVGRKIARKRIAHLDVIRSMGNILKFPGTKSNAAPPGRRWTCDFD